ncbi:hypothetical protein D3C80_2058140 [compost metagenome]
MSRILVVERLSPMNDTMTNEQQRILNVLNVLVFQDFKHLVNGISMRVHFFVPLFLLLLIVHIASKFDRTTL